MTDIESERGSATLAARFIHFEKLPAARRALLGPAHFAEASAALAGIGVDELDRIRRSLADDLRDRVDELLREDGIRRLLDRLSWRDGDVVVALGDSITDDSLSWANLLARLVRRGRPALDVRFVNAGITGNTTQEAISRFDTIASERPTLVIQLLGTNDVRRHGRLREPTTSPAETRRNLEVLHRLVVDETGARHLVMTPPPTDDRRSRAWAPFDAEGIAWDADDVAAAAATIRDSGAQLDLHTALDIAAEPELLTDDGVHPSLDGQTRILRLLLESLAAHG